jgi:hypothetical protein
LGIVLQDQQVVLVVPDQQVLLALQEHLDLLVVMVVHLFIDKI